MDIVLFDSPYYLNYYKLKKRRKLIEGNIKEFLRYSKKDIFLYDPNYSLEEGIIKKIAEHGKPSFLIALRDLFLRTGKERAIMLFRIQIFIKLLKRYGLNFYLVSLSDEEDLRTFREKVYVGMLLGLDMKEAKRRAKLFFKQQA